MYDVLFLCQLTDYASNIYLVLEHLDSPKSGYPIRLILFNFTEWTGSVS